MERSTRQTSRFKFAFDGAWSGPPPVSRWPCESLGASRELVELKPLAAWMWYPIHLSGEFPGQHAWQHAGRSHGNKHSAVFYEHRTHLESDNSMALPCRPDCGACCTAPSISSPIPGMPGGKPAGVRCVQLAPDQRCLIFNDPRRPAVCSGLQPAVEMCGTSRVQAMAYLTWLEEQTRV